MAVRVRTTGAQQLSLRDAFSVAFDSAEFWALLLKLNRSSAIYRIDGTHEEQVLAALQSAENEAWLVDLLAEARLQRNADAELARLQQELALVALPPTLRPFDMCCLSGDYILINRAKLRKAVEAMTLPQAKRILIVRDRQPPASALAATKTGKTLSVQFIAELEQQLAGFESVIVDLRAFKDDLGPNQDVTAEELARKLVRLLGYPRSLVPPPPVDGQWSRWSAEVIDDLQSAARKDPRQLWLVIDEFNKVALPQDTLDFVKKLADRVRVGLPNCRLILLGFRDSLTPSVHPHVEEEAVERQVSVRDMVDFFMRAAMQRRLTLTEAMLRDEVTQVLQGLDPQQDDFLEALARRAVDALNRLADAETSAAGDQGGP